MSFSSKFLLKQPLSRYQLNQGSEQGLSLSTLSFFVYLYLPLYLPYLLLNTRSAQSELRARVALFLSLSLCIFFLLHFSFFCSQGQESSSIMVKRRISPLSLSLPLCLSIVHLIFWYLYSLMNNYSEPVAASELLSEQPRTREQLHQVGEQEQLSVSLPPSLSLYRSSYLVISLQLNE